MDDDEATHSIASRPASVGLAGHHIVERHKAVSLVNVELAMGIVLCAAAVLESRTTKRERHALGVLGPAELQRGNAVDVEVGVGEHSRLGAPAPCAAPGERGKFLLQLHLHLPVHLCMRDRLKRSSVAAIVGLLVLLLGGEAETELRHGHGGV